MHYVFSVYLRNVPCFCPILHMNCSVLETSHTFKEPAISSAFHPALPITSSSSSPPPPSYPLPSSSPPPSRLQWAVAVRQQCLSFFCAKLFFVSLFYCLVFVIVSRFVHRWRTQQSSILAAAVIFLYWYSVL